jgi:hypothetical protein
MIFKKQKIIVEMRSKRYFINKIDIEVCVNDSEKNKE